MGEIALYTVFHCLPLAEFSSIHEHADTQGLVADLVRIALSREPSLNGSCPGTGSQPLCWKAKARLTRNGLRLAMTECQVKETEASVNMLTMNWRSDILTTKHKVEKYY